MANEKFSDLAHRIRRFQDDLAKQTKELAELRSELARLKQIMGTLREALQCIDTYSYKGGMTSDAEKKAHAQLAEFMNKDF
jgi:cell division protein FtsB